VWWREGETVLIPQGTKFILEFGSRFLRFLSFCSGDGIDALIHRAGKPFNGFILPDKPLPFEEDGLLEACKELSIELGAAN
jgi:hypothetical protein